jgi:hypothetical protein
MSELDAALALEPKQPVRTERNFALTKGIAGAVVSLDDLVGAGEQIGRDGDA